MLPIIILGIIGILLGATLAYEDDDIGAGFVCAFLFAFFGLLIAGLIGVFVYGSKERVSDPVPLQNMVDNTYTEGHFFLGTGSIDGVPHYSWYEKTDANSYERRDIEVDEATVHYLIDDSKPYYTKTYEENENDKYWHTWTINPDAGYSQVNHYDFYIPRGSITNEYKLDAK